MGRARWPRIANCFKRREEREMVKQSIINRVREVDFSSKHTRYKRVPQVLNVLLFLLKKMDSPLCKSSRIKTQSLLVVAATFCSPASPSRGK